MRFVPVASSRRFTVFFSLLALLLLLAVITARGVQAKDKAREEKAEGAVLDPIPVADEPIKSLPQPNVRLEGYGSDRVRRLPERGFEGAIIFDEPVAGSPAWLSKLFCPLPARPEMLAPETPDAADTEKLRTLRDSYEEILKEKASLLNAEALSAEIELQRRQVTELKALKELQKLQQSLQELSDKFPNSDAGQRARDVLQWLKQRGANSRLNLTPTPDDSFQRISPVPTYDSSEEKTLPGFQDDRRPRSKPQDQPSRPRAVPAPIEEEKAVDQ